MITFVMLPSYLNHHFMDIAVVMMKIIIIIIEKQLNNTEEIPAHHIV